MSGIECLKKHDVDFNVLSVVTSKNARSIKSIYRFFIDEGLMNHQFIPCLDPLEACSSNRCTGTALSAPLYTRFLKDLFDLWFEDRMAGVPVYNRYFENLAGILMGYLPESCNMRGRCAIQYAIEANGNVYPCDFYMMDNCLLGNINHDDIHALDLRRFKMGFVEHSCALPTQCYACKWFSLCHAGCYRERAVRDVLQPPLHRYCEAYKEFFPYAIPRLGALL